MGVRTWQPLIGKPGADGVVKESILGVTTDGAIARIELERITERTDRPFINHIRCVQSEPGRAAKEAEPE